MPRIQKKFDPAFLIIVGIIVVLATMVAVIVTNIQTDDLSSHLEESELLPLLIFISDDRQLVASQLLIIDSNTRNMAIYDIPRRLGAIIPSLGRVDRIDNLYSELGPQETRDILEIIFDIKIDFFLDMELSDVETIVDLTEGVTVFLSAPIEDEINGKIIRIPGGNVRLDGEKAVDLLLYEGADERELEWISRRWGFTRELLRSMRENLLIQENDELFTRFSRHLGANFGQPGVHTFLTLISTISLENILTQRILGSEREVETAKGKENILFPHFEGQLVRDSIDQISRSLGSLETAYASALSNQLEILNGTGTNGLAARTRDLYQNFGFEVIRIGNSEEDYEKTLIIDRSNNIEGAEKVGSLIRAENIANDQPLVDNPEVDITIILGADFDGWYVRSTESE